MSQVFSEINKFVNVHPPISHVASTSYNTDIVDMENYKKCTFYIATGISAANTPVVTVAAAASNATTGALIAFKYRTQCLVAATSSSGDVPSALTDATTTGFAVTTAIAGGSYIIEVDAATVAAAGTDYDHVYLKMSTGAIGATYLAGITAILSEPRYPQAILQTAIE